MARAIAGDSTTAEPDCRRKHRRDTWPRTLPAQRNCGGVVGVGRLSLHRLAPEPLETCGEGRLHRLAKFAHLTIRQAGPESVAAGQQHITAAQTPQPRNGHVGNRSITAKAGLDVVAQRMAVYLGLTDQSLLQQQLDMAVVTRPLDDPPAAQLIDPAVTDVGPPRTVILGDGHGTGRPRSDIQRKTLSQRDDLGMGPAKRKVQKSLRIQQGLRRSPERALDDRDGGLCRPGAIAVATHAVDGHEQPRPTMGPDEHAVLVFLTIAYQAETGRHRLLALRSVLLFDRRLFHTGVHARPVARTCRVRQRVRLSQIGRVPADLQMYSDHHRNLPTHRPARNPFAVQPDRLRGSPDADQRAQNMIRSMTGYARHEQAFAGELLTWEARSVNHRFLELSFRLPEALRAEEAALKVSAQQRLGRGKVDLNLRMVPTADAVPALELNAPLVLRLHALANQIGKLTGQQQGVSVRELLRWPGVVEERSEPPAGLAAAAQAGLETLLTDLIKAREREGQRLAEGLVSRCDAIETLAAGIAVRMPELRSGQLARLRERIARLGVEADEGRLEQELALLASRIDVAEELDRLQAHVAEIRDILTREEPVGRRLDFLIQELNREANTLGSKSTDTEVTRAAVDLKVLIEQMREQVQNVE